MASYNYYLIFLDNNHFFIYCAPAAFLKQFLHILTIRTLGFSVDLNLELLIFNEIPYNKCKTLDNDKKKLFFCLLNSYKATLFGLYYLRPLRITGDLLLHKFQQNLNVACKIIKDRNSQLTPNFALPQSTGRTFLNYQRIKSNIFNETSHLRHYDNETRRSSFLLQNRMNHIQLNTNPPRSSRTQNIKMPSLPKKQILIQEAFSRIRNKKFTEQYFSR